MSRFLRTVLAEPPSPGTPTAGHADNAAPPLEAHRYGNPFILTLPNQYYTSNNGRPAPVAVNNTFSHISTALTPFPGNLSDPTPSLALHNPPSIGSSGISSVCGPILIRRSLHPGSPEHIRARATSIIYFPQLKTILFPEKKHHCTKPGCTKSFKGVDGLLYHQRLKGACNTRLSLYEQRAMDLLVEKCLEREIDGLGGVPISRAEMKIIAGEIHPKVYKYRCPQCQIGYRSGSGLRYHVAKSLEERLPGHNLQPGQRILVWQT